jgi:hypothetical protein
MPERKTATRPEGAPLFSFVRSFVTVGNAVAARISSRVAGDLPSFGFPGTPRESWPGCLPGQVLIASARFQ